MKLYFARHGESEANIEHVLSNRDADEYPLTEQGRAQAHALAHSLADVPLTRLYTSPLLRAIETSRIVAEAKGLTPRIVEALREYDCGVLEGQSDLETWALHEQTWRDWLERGHFDSAPEGGESFEDIRQRFVPLIDLMIERYAETPNEFLLVGHGGLFRAMLPVVLSNIDAAYAVSHPMSPATTVVAEWCHDQLVCIEWCGEQIL